ncbi:MAG TPA: hypothetical protein PLT82_04970 [Candidatus Hydrogenedens sp.]|nr:hypothetical protein [Candidatus Hydrogenedens sp.]HOL20655.1 hypothetical protein [Candidatus Hydrogenedens sp.]HPP58465.1 hypothetical protein [Candidatus Hydrogenedens sp.]
MECRLFYLIKRYALLIVLCIGIVSCEGRYVISGKVFATNGEPLPGVSISSPETLDYTITNTKGEFVYRLQKPISKIEFIKSDYLPMQITVDSWQEKKITLPNIVLTSKPSISGVYFFDERNNRYIPLFKNKIERIQIDTNNSIPAIKMNMPITIETTKPRVFVFRMPQYELSLYKMKKYIQDKEEVKKNKTEEKEKKSSNENVSEEERYIWIPDEPILVSTEFLSELDTSLFVVKPVDDLKTGVYCINWRAFEVPFPRINDSYLFSVKTPQQEEKISDSSSIPNETIDKNKEEDKTKENKK